MSKTETVRGLSASPDAPASQLGQLLTQLKELREQIEASEMERVLPQVEGLRQQIDQLPPAIAQQVSEALAPLEGLSLSEIEQLAQLQRTTLDTMANELTSQATRSFERSTKQLLAKINQTSGQLEQATANLKAAAEAAAKLPPASDRLRQQAEAMRPRWWKGPVLALSSALMSAAAVVVMTGTLDLSGLVPLSGESAQQMERLLKNATADERELLNEIYNRRAP